MFVLNHHQSIANQFLAELRDVSKQDDRLRFRRNLERLGEIMAYEISKGMDFHTTSIETPLKETRLDLISNQPVIISILRAAVSPPRTDSSGFPVPNATALTSAS